MNVLKDILKGCFFVLLMVFSLAVAHTASASDGYKVVDGGERAEGSDLSILAKELKKVKLGYLLNGYTDGDLRVHDFKQPTAPAADKPSAPSQRHVSRQSEACVQMRQAYEQAKADSQTGVPAYITYDDVQAACYQ